MISSIRIRRLYLDGRSRRFALNFERRLSDPLLTKSLEAARRRYVPKTDMAVSIVGAIPSRFTVWPQLPEELSQDVVDCVLGTDVEPIYKQALERP